MLQFNQHWRGYDSGQTLEGEFQVTTTHKLHEG